MAFSFHDKSPEANKDHRVAAFKWLRSSSTPWGLPLWLSICLSPMRKYLGSELRLNSLLEETKRNESLCTNSAEGVTGLLGSTEWPLLVASRGIVDQQVMDMTARLHDPQALSPWPSSCKTLNFQHLMFRMLSSEGAYCVQFLVSTHKGFPFLLFQLLSDGSSRNTSHMSTSSR